MKNSYNEVEMYSFEEKLSPILYETGDIITAAYTHLTEGDIKEKGEDPANMVTVYDLAVQKHLMDRIKAIYPNASFIAEEKDNDPGVLQDDLCFILDPIDGTTNFVRGFRHSAISLAVFSHGEAVFAAILNPYQKELFTATRGGGARLNGMPIRMEAKDLAHALVAYGTSPYRKDLAEKTFHTAKAFFLATGDVRRLGSAALDLAYLAAGRCDIFFEYQLSPWDIAAGYLLVKEAGGIITDMDGNEIDFSRPSTVFASSAQLYKDAFAVLNQANA